jgi:hypothetical protein
VHGELAVDEDLTDVDGEPPALADERDASPAAGVAARGQLRGTGTGAVQRDLGALAEQVAELVVGPDDDVVDRPQRGRQRPAGG